MSIYQFAVTFENKSHHYKENFSKDIGPKELINRFSKDFGLDYNSLDEFLLIVHIKDEAPFYLKDNNVQCLPRVYMMDLCPLPEKEVSDIKNQMTSKDHDVAKKALECLANRLSVQEFVRLCVENGLHIDLFRLVEKVMQIKNGNEELSVLTMKVFAEFIVYTSKKEDFETEPDADERVFISWLNIKPETIRSTLDYCKTTQNFNGIDSSLKVLVRYVNQNDTLRDFIFKNLDSVFIFNLFEKLHKSINILRPLKCSIQISLISLINCSFASSRDTKDKFIEKLNDYFGKDKFRGLKENIDLITRKLREFPSELPPAGCSVPSKEENDLKQELTKLQYFILLPVYWDFSDTNYDGPKINDLELLKQMLSGNDSDTDVQIYEKLGFQNTLSPSRDFTEPPGHLVFSCIKYLINNCDEINHNFVKRVFNNIPLIKIAFSLVKILDRALQLTEIIDENMDGGLYLPILFHACEIDHELSRKFFYELFQKCFMVYAQSLIDLKFKVEDLELESYFLNQINEVLNCYPTTFHELSIWLGKVRSENTRKKKLEDQITEWESNQNIQNPIINQLRTELENEYKALINKKRIRQLQERPHAFDLRSTRSVQRYSLQLDESQSLILAKEESDPNSKVNKWPISNIKQILIDKSCSHYNQRKENTYYFSITMDSRDDAKDDPVKTYNFSCNHKKNYAVWIDGLNILMNKPPTSQEFKEDLLNLVRMEMKIRFLFLSKENIHHEAPALPTLPSNYDFIN